MVNNIKEIISSWVENLNKDKNEEKQIYPSSNYFYEEG